MWLASSSGLFSQPLMPSAATSYTLANRLAGASYDAAGNQIAMGAMQLFYDANNQLVQADSVGAI